MTNISFVDADDTVIGEGSKQEAWSKGIACRIVRIFIFNVKGDLLILKRSDNRTSLPGRWDQSAAGHVDAGEDYLTAAKRELEEEAGITGLELVEKGNLYTNETDEADKVKKRFNRLYVAVYDGEVHPNTEEVSEARWIAPAELDEWMQNKPDDFTEGFRRCYEYYTSLISNDYGVSLQG
jgi:16S rRNA (adenine1518-N6/adenine1519-N6)-dimethyltransferase